MSSFTHLGHLFTNQGDMEDDVKNKRAKMIKDTMEIQDQLKELHPREQLYMIQKYCSDYYGSSLWKLSGAGVRKPCNSWDVTVKKAYQLPRKTHKHLSRYLSQFPPVLDELMSRSIKFLKGVLTSPSMEVHVVANVLINDRTSTIGDNLETVEAACGGSPMFLAKWKLMTTLESRRRASQEEMWTVDAGGAK